MEPVAEVKVMVPPAFDYVLKVLTMEILQLEKVVLSKGLQVEGVLKLRNGKVIEKQLGSISS